MDRIQNLLQELNAYFIAKIVAKDYTVEEIDGRYVKIEIDNRHRFCFWLSEYSDNILQHSHHNTIKLDLTNNEVALLRVDFLKIVESGKIQAIRKEIAEKEEELKKLNQLLTTNK